MKNQSVKFKWWYCMIIGIAAIIDGLTMFFTIGYYPTSLQLKFALWGAMKRVYRKSK